MPHITIDAGARTLRGYLAVPAGSGPFPGVVVLHEIWGMHREMKRHADRLAAHGYLALIPDLYTDGGMARCLVATMRALRSGEGKALSDIETARQWILAQPNCTGRVGAIGFCLGGGFAILVAGRGFDVVAPNYGPVPRDIDRALERACPVVASYGRRDKYFRNSAATLQSALARRAIPNDVMEYSDAGHAFLNEEHAGPFFLRPYSWLVGSGPHAASATDAWRRIDGFFARYLS
jgi:carboxymethylenebutenolidase